MENRSSPLAHTADQEPDAAQWSRVEGLLRRLISRLTFAADGRSGALDATLVEIRRHVRQPLAEAAIEPLLAALAEAVKSLDDAPLAAAGPRAAPAGGSVPAPSEPAPGVPAPADAGALLLHLLEQLRLDEPDDESVQTLRDGLASAADAAALLAQAQALAALINRRLRRMSEEKAAAERLLLQVTEQLEALDAFLAQADSARRDGAGDRQALDRDVVAEMKALGQHVRQASDLHTLREDVSARVGAIGQHLRVFRQREEQREREWQARAEQMHERIRELERSAQTMEATLRQEQQAAAIDPLTGVANRGAFEQCMARLCAAAPTASLLVLDIDRFKQINDSFGHSAGDRALKIVAEQLRASLREGDLVARYGGEEFVVVLPAADPAKAHHVAEMLRTRIASLGFHGEQQPVRITLSCGVTTLRPGDTPQSAFERADRALYRAKREGRNRSVVA